jgi:hypothetical protein
MFVFGIVVPESDLAFQIHRRGSDKEPVYCDSDSPMELPSVQIVSQVKTDYAA